MIDLIKIRMVFILFLIVLSAALFCRANAQINGQQIASPFAPLVLP